MQPTSFPIGHKSSRAFSLLVTLCLLATGLLTACGSANTPAPATSMQTSATTTAAVVVTVEPTATLIPPTATTAPSPTPEPPKPNALVMGDPENPWVDISRYQPTSNIKLEEVKLNTNVSSSFGTWFAAAPQLAVLPGGSNLYRVTFAPGIANKIATGEFAQVYTKTGDLLPIVRNAATGKFVAVGRLSGAALPALANPVGLAFTVLSVLGSMAYMDGINSQLETINRNIEAVKDFQEQKEYSALIGDLQYMDGLRKIITEQKLSPSDLQAFRIQLEKIDNESIQAMKFAQVYMDRTYTTYKDTRIDKGLFGTRDEKKIDDFGVLLSDYQRHANNYYLALSVRGMSAQLTCALPESKDVALTRLQEVQKSLTTWRDDQNTFFDLAIARLPEMDGLFTDTKKQDAYRKSAVTAKDAFVKRYNEVDSELTEIVKTTKDQMQAAQLPTDLVVELDGQGKLVKVSRVVPTN